MWKKGTGDRCGVCHKPTMSYIELTTRELDELEAETLANWRFNKDRRTAVTILRLIATVKGERKRARAATEALRRIRDGVAAYNREV